MTELSEADADRAEAMFLVARAQLQRAIRAIERKIETLESSGAEGAVEKATTELSAALQTYLNERTRVEKLIDGYFGKEGRVAIDLGAARDEVQRRLARLRASKAAGKVS